jgi:hypothetical protein
VNRIFGGRSTDFNDKNLYPRDTRRYDRTYEFGVRASF